MPVPSETQKRISEALAEVRQASDHQLAEDTRFGLYQSFGPSTATKAFSAKPFSGPALPANYSEADRAFNWLSVLTARKVLLVWQELGFPDRESAYSILKPQYWLGTAESFLTGKIPAEQLRFYTYSKFALALEDLEWDVTEPVYYSIYTIFKALQISLSEFDTEPGTRFTNPPNDLAADAIKAFAGVDSNKAGRWVIALHDDVEGYVPLRYEPGRTLEFWEWWLQEAIPQAWELASLHK